MPADKPTLGQRFRQLRAALGLPVNLGKLPAGERFTLAWREGSWTDGGRFPRSGASSSLDQTSYHFDHAMQVLTQLMPDRTRIRIVDAPCGDLTWMPAFLERLAEYYQRVAYVGIDVVPALIAANQGVTPPAANISMRFECRDIIDTPIPAGDLLLCKDLVNHLPDRDIENLLRNIAGAPCRYVAINTDQGNANQDLKVTDPGASHPVNLEARPWSLPPPLARIGNLGIWKLPLAYP